MTRFYTGTYGKHRSFYKDYGQRVILTKSSHFLEYIKLHLISLNQDLEELINNKSNVWQEASDAEENYINGQIKATEHLLSVATDIMNSSNERYE
jgi:hypothetical protein